MDTEEDDKRILKCISQPLEGLLYDLDLLPEQCRTGINSMRRIVVEQQRKEIERLRKALKDIIDNVHSRIKIRSIAEHALKEGK